MSANRHHHRGIVYGIYERVSGTYYEGRGTVIITMMTISHSEPVYEDVDMDMDMDMDASVNKEAGAGTPTQASRPELT